MKPALIQHRANTAESLNSLSKMVSGCEIDLRSDVTDPNSIHLSHDAWSRGVDLENWIVLYKSLNLSGPLILNTKEDGLEERVLDVLNKHSIQNFFFLDTPIPTLIKWTNRNEMRFAVRLSEYEPKSFVERFRGIVDWVWVDCFDAKPIDAELLPSQGFKICLVSPELQGGNPEQIPTFQALAKRSHAVCTKFPEKWLE